MLAALGGGDLDVAAGQLKDSKWFGQVGLRGPALVQMLGEGTA